MRVLPLEVDLLVEAGDALIDERELRCGDPPGLETRPSPSGSASCPAACQWGGRPGRTRVGCTGLPSRTLTARRRPFRRVDHGSNESTTCSILRAQLRVRADDGAAFPGGNVLAAAKREEGDRREQPGQSSLVCAQERLCAVLDHRDVVRGFVDGVHVGRIAEHVHRYHSRQTPLSSDEGPRPRGCSRRCSSR